MLSFTRNNQFISAICQHEVQALFEICATRLKPFYAKDGLTVYEVEPKPDLHSKYTAKLCIIHNGKPNNFDPHLVKNDRNLAIAVHESMGESYIIGALCHYHTDILDAVAAISPEIAATMREKYQAACIADPDANEDAQRFAAMIAGIEGWSQYENYIFDYDRTRGNASVRHFGDHNYEAFTLNGHFMIVCHASAMAYAARAEDGGIAWYSQRKEYGQSDPQTKDDIDREVPFAGENKFLKHIFAPKNVIAKTIDGKLVPMDAKIFNLAIITNVIHETLLEEGRVQPIQSTDEEAPTSPAPQ